MKAIYKSTEGERLVLNRYQAFLKFWPVPNEKLRCQPVRGKHSSSLRVRPTLRRCFFSMAARQTPPCGSKSPFARCFRVYCIDMIGEAGLSAPARPPLASDAHAVWLDDVLNHLGVARTSIVGISLAGWLALDYAVRRLARVERVAVLCPGGIGRQ